MDKSKQNLRAGEIHAEATEKGRTCIDCHIGIAHQLPKELLDAEHNRFERENIPCSNCHADMPRIPADEDWGWD